MAASVQVLCPNGRRQTVKVTPNTKLLQVLEEVCHRQGFIPPEDFKLVQGRKEFDLSLSFRFSSLPNNAKLELAKSTTSRMEQEVTIALQLDSGQRLHDNFYPSTTLWDILLKFEEKNDELKGQLTRVDTNQQGKSLHPVCIFMREEVVGQQALQATTLKKLALTSGKAVIRFLHRSVEENIIADICDQVEKEKAKQARLEEIAQKKKKVLEEQERQSALKSSIGERLEEVKEERDLSGGGEDSKSQQQLHEDQQQQLQHVGGEAMEVDNAKNDDDTLSSASLSVDSSSRNRTLRTIAAISHPGNQSHQPNPIAELRDLNIPGVEIFTPDDFNDLSPAEQAIAQRLAQRFLPHLQQASTSSQVSNAETRLAQINQLQDEQSANAFLDFKFPEETKGKDLSSAENSNSSQPDSSPCERNTLVYNASQALPVTNQELPDSFFEVTQSDVRLMYKDLQSAVNKLEDQPLMTKTMKQAMAEAAFDHYPQVIIRIHFPDKFVLQAFFRPRETVGGLHKFVRNCLEEKNLKFYLYTTPPRTILKDMKSTLAVNHLAPAALVYFGCDQDRDHYIKQDLLQNIKSRVEAETCVAEVLNSHDGDSLPSSASPADSTTSNQQTAGPSGMSSGNRTFPSHSSSPATLPSGAKVPKWLKLGKK